MVEWFAEFWASLTLSRAALGIGVLLISVAISFVAIVLVMIKIPEDYFSPRHTREFLADRKWIVRWGAVVGKNVAGGFLVLLGLVLMIPGVPGPGLLTALLGLILLDIPGKRPFEARLIGRPAILSSINKLRGRYNKPPLILD